MSGTVRFFFSYNIKGELEILPEILTIKEFQDVIYKEGNNITKNNKPTLQITDKGMREMAFIFWLGLTGSPYIGIAEYSLAKKDLNEAKITENVKILQEAIEKIKSEVKLPESWYPDNTTGAAIEKWQFLQQNNKTFNLLLSIEKAIKKLEDYIHDINLNETIESGPRKGELVHNPKVYSDITKSLSSHYKDLQEITTKYYETMADTFKIKSKKDINPFEN